MVNFIPPLVGRTFDNLQTQVANTEFSLFQFSSVIQLCPTLWDPMDYSTPAFPVHHQLPELTQTHVHQVVMPSNHLILCCPLLLLSIFPSIRVFPTELLFTSGGQSIGVSASVLPMNIQYWFPLGLTLLIFLLSNVFSSTTMQKHQYFSAQLSL